MSIVVTLSSIQITITRYAFPIILAFGNLGNLMTIGIYLQKKYRTNSCSIYLSARSFFGLMGANWSIIPLVYALDNYNMVDNSLAFCRIRGYILQTSSQCFRFILVLGCADRYALCSVRASIRAFSRPKIAYRAIGITISVWAVLSSHLLIWESIENGRCSVYGLYGQIFSVYVIVFSSLLPLLLMIILGILLMKNLRRLHSQVQPISNSNRLNQRDTSLMKLILVEVLAYVICTFTYPIMLIYSQSTAGIASIKSANQKAIEGFLVFITQPLLLYLNYNTTFYIHVITSKAFRNEVKQLVLKCFRKSAENTQNYESGLTTMVKASQKQQPKITSVT